MDDRPILLINGAASPLGQTLARQYAEHYRLALYDTDSFHCRQLAQQLHLKQYSALSLSLDRNLDGNPAEHVIARLQQRWHGLDILINLPAVPAAGPFLALGHQRWQQQTQQQLLEPVQWCQAALAVMQDQGRGLVINGHIPVDLVPANLNSLEYCLTQAIISLSQNLDEEFRAQAIHVQAMAMNPGSSDQPLQPWCNDPLSKARLQRSLANHPLTMEQQCQSIGEQLALYGKTQHSAAPSRWRNWRRWLPGGKA